MHEQFRLVAFADIPAIQHLDLLCVVLHHGVALALRHILYQQLRTINIFLFPILIPHTHRHKNILPVLISCDARPLARVMLSIQTARNDAPARLNSSGMISPSRSVAYVRFCNSSIQCTHASEHIMLRNRLSLRVLSRREWRLPPLLFFVATMLNPRF